MKGLLQSLQNLIFEMKLYVATEGVSDSLE